VEGRYLRVVIGQKICIPPSLTDKLPANEKTFDEMSVQAQYQNGVHTLDSRLVASDLRVQCDNTKQSIEINQKCFA